jgi:hypothetical protein
MLVVFDFLMGDDFNLVGDVDIVFDFDSVFNFDFFDIVSAFIIVFSGDTLSEFFLLKNNLIGDTVSVFFLMIFVDVLIVFVDLNSYGSINGISESCSESEEIIICLRRR